MTDQNTSMNDFSRISEGGQVMQLKNKNIMVSQTSTDITVKSEPICTFFEYLIEQKILYKDIYETYLCFDELKDQICNSFLPISGISNCNFPDIYEMNKYTSDCWDKIHEKFVAFISNIDRIKSIIQCVDSDSDAVRIIEEFRKYLTNDFIKNYNKELFFNQHRGEFMCKLYAIGRNTYQNIIIPYQKQTFHSLNKKQITFSESLKSGFYSIMSGAQSLAEYAHKQKSKKLIKDSEEDFEEKDIGTIPLPGSLSSRFSFDTKETTTFKEEETTKVMEGWHNWYLISEYVPQKQDCNA